MNNVNVNTEPTKCLEENLRTQKTQSIKGRIGKLDFSFKTSYEENSSGLGENICRTYIC